MSIEKFMINDTLSNNSEDMSNKQIDTPTDTPTQKQLTHCKLEQLAEMSIIIHACRSFQLSYMEIAETLYNRGYCQRGEGEWIEASNKPHAAIGKKCSLCGARISYREFGHGNHKYCHKCGAKMRGESK